MVRAGIPAPTLQVNLHDESGWVAACDFGWPDRGIVGEVDGQEKFDKQVEKGASPGEVVLKQQGRDDLIRGTGHWPVHWGWRQAWNVIGLRNQLREAFKSAADWRAGR